MVEVVAVLKRKKIIMTATSTSMMVNTVFIILSLATEH